MRVGQTPGGACARRQKLKGNERDERKEKLEVAASVGAILSSIRIKDREPERRRRGSQFDVTLTIGAGLACGGHAGMSRSRQYLGEF